MGLRALVFAAALAATAAAHGNGSQGGGAAQAGDPASGSPSAEGRKLFIGGTSPSCATCHALKAAGATGNIGPDLDALVPDAARVRDAVKMGFENMPAFGDALSNDQIDVLARYVESATRRR